MDVPLTVTFGRYTLVVDDSSSCAFHMWGPGVDVITSDGVNRFQVEFRRNATYTAACNWKDIGPHPPHSEGLDTDNMPWSATVRVTG
jgi:hypothetical protein